MTDRPITAERRTEERINPEDLLEELVGYAIARETNNLCGSRRLDRLTRRALRWRVQQRAESEAA